MVKSKEDILSAIKEQFGEEPNDAVISILEDVSDTIDGVNKGEDWKEKYEENDRNWRKKYTERFVASPVNDTQQETEQSETEPDEEPKTFEDLFKQD